MDTVNVDDDTIYEEQKNTSAALIGYVRRL